MRLLARAVRLLFILFPPFVYAQEIPLSNWTVPPYRGSSAAGGLTTMADVTPGIGFVGVAPCRLVDTRQAGFPAGYGTPALVQGQPRNFDLNSDPQCTAIPAGVDAYSLNITVTNTQGPGFILIYPQGGAQPPVSTVNYVAGQTIANAAVVPAGTGGGVTVIAGVSGTDLVIDINGYFTDAYNAGVSFHAVSASVAPAILGENTSTAANAVAIQGVITSTTPGNFAAAVKGISNGTGTISYGVFGSVAELFNASSGVLGVGSGGRVTPTIDWANSTGVRGESASNGVGVLGLTTEGGQGSGVRGLIINTAGNAVVAGGYLGLKVSGLNYGLASDGNARVIGSLEVTGNFSSANKFFIEPHPYDASKEIRYVSLEGPHAEVYFRGTAQISRGISRIAIPQDFRFVADPATYSTLITPVGGMASVAVLSEGADGVVVQASRDVKVHYVVYAERSAVKNPDPIVENIHFRPMGNLDVFASMPESYRRLLVQNGTLNPDGTLNRETARRLGWDISHERQATRTPSE